jgi:ABC-2 type transport system permease protein
MKPFQKILSDLYLACLLAWKDCIVMLHQRATVVFMVVIPLSMVCITGLALQGFEPRGIETKVALEDDDGGPFAARFREEVRRAAEPPGPGEPAGAEEGARVQFLPDPLGGEQDRQEARRRVRDGELGGLIVLPAGFSERLAKGEAAQVQLVVGTGNPLVRSVVEASVDRLLARAGERIPRESPAPLVRQPVEEKSTHLVEGFNSFSQAVAGNGVLSILLNCIVIGALAIVRERHQHTLDRLMIAPLSRQTIILGKILGVYVIGVIQAALVFGFGGAIGVRFGSPLGVVLVTLVFILVGCALGLTISALARREEQVQMIGGPVGMIMTALGGALFPVEMAPVWMQWVSLLFPTGWAMQAYHRLMWEGRDWTAVLPNLLVLAGFAAVFLVVGVRSLRWE